MWTLGWCQNIRKKYLVAIYFNSQSGKENKFSNFSKIIVGFSKGFHNNSVVSLYEMLGTYDKFSTLRFFVKTFAVRSKTKQRKRDHEM